MSAFSVFYLGIGVIGHRGPVFGLRRWLRPDKSSCRLRRGDSRLSLYTLGSFGCRRLGNALFDYWWGMNRLGMNEDYDNPALMKIMQQASWFLRTLKTKLLSRKRADSTFVRILSAAWFSVTLRSEGSGDIRTHVPRAHPPESPLGYMSTIPTASGPGRRSVGR